MQTELTAFLARGRPQVEEAVSWHHGSMLFHVTSYHGDELPPLGYVTSVRGIVFRDQAVLVCHRPEGVHLLPGGRREPGETLEETLHRELLEETGWRVEVGPRLGFMHFRHLSPKPDGYPYPHPEFVQLVYLAAADEFVPGVILPHTDAVESEFLPVPEVEALDLGPSQRLYLEAALSARSSH